MLNVYFEDSKSAELVATFMDENTYVRCLPSLKKLCLEEGYTRVTESEVEKTEHASKEKELLLAFATFISEETLTGLLARPIWYVDKFTKKAKS
jgi:hypothetical protein